MPNKYPIIAAVRTMPELKAALVSKVSTIFLLNANILSINAILKKANELDKQIYVHIDLAEGIGKDAAGLEYLAKQGLSGVISTKNSIIRQAMEFDLKTIQRLFVLDSQSLTSGMGSLAANHPDYIEIMPGIVTKAIKAICESGVAPVIAGGLIETQQEVKIALSAGAAAVSTSKAALWNMELETL